MSYESTASSTWSILYPCTSPTFSVSLDLLNCTPTHPKHFSICLALIVEGIYRIPGNTAQVELLKEMFQHDKAIDIHSIDIGVNAVATALKGFFSDLSEPLVPAYLNQELVVADSKCEWHSLLPC